MSHTFYADDDFHAFQCDHCGKVAGISHDEQQALHDARRKADREGWKWFHPHWGLVCPECRWLVLGEDVPCKYNYT